MNVESYKDKALCLEPLSLRFQKLVFTNSLIFYSDANSQSRRAGVRVYVSDTIEEAKNEGLCYMDQMADFVFPQPHLVLADGSFSCTKRDGRYVILYVDRPTQTPIRNCPTGTMYSCWANLELCEVEIYGRWYMFARGIVKCVWHVWRTKQSLYMSRLMDDKNQQNGMCAQRRQVSLGIRPVRSESSLSAWRKLESLAATHWAHSEDSDQTRRMPRLIWVFAGHTVIVLVLSWGSSYHTSCIVNLSKFGCTNIHNCKRHNQKQHLTKWFIQARTQRGAASAGMRSLPPSCSVSSVYTPNLGLKIGNF